MRSSDHELTCGCIVHTDRTGRESYSVEIMCAPHRAEFEKRHEAARKSGSEVYRQQTLREQAIAAGVPAHTLVGLFADEVTP